MVALVERLEVAAEQVREVRRSIQSEGQGYRLDIALQAIQSAVGLLKSSPIGSNGYVAPAEGDRGGFPINIIWERPRKRQRFEGQLLENGKIRLLDGRGSFTPSGACKALVGGSFDGWRDWKYWDEGEEKWLPIDELRVAGYFD